MQDLPAVPLMVVLRDGNLGGATGCFVDVGGTTMLVTSAHVPTGTHPVTDWAIWHHELTIATEHRPTVPLFTMGAFGRKPRFFFMRSSDDPSVLIDVIAIPCHPAEVGLTGVRVHSIYSSGVQVGQEVTLHGYPLNVDHWPTLSILTGPVIGLDEAFLVAHLGSTGGFSGGPVTGPDGLFLGVVAGTGRKGMGDDAARIVVPGLIAALPELVNGRFPADASTPMFPTLPHS